jgi:hypothetical protein
MQKLFQSLLQMNWCCVVGISALVLAVGGCGSATTRHESTLLPCGITAEPVAPGGEMAKLDMTKSREGLVRTFDGEPFCPKRRCDHRTIVVPPGKHDVIFSYMKSYSVLGPGGRDAVKMTFEAKPGETYRAIVSTTGVIGWSYNCKLVEVSTGRTVAEIDDCDRDEIRGPAIQAVFDSYGGRQKYIDADCY